MVPDLPMLGFYLWEKIRGVPERVIWRQDYFLPGWQTFFDVFSSLPLIALGWIVARWRSHALAQLVFLSLGLHSLTDLLTHGEDAHRHLWPLPWRFESPVSYWDPSRYGWLVFPLELLLVTVGSVWLYRRWRDEPIGRGILILNGAVYLAFVAFAAATWG